MSTRSAPPTEPAAEPQATDRLEALEQQLSMLMEQHAALQNENQRLRTHVGTTTVIPDSPTFLDNYHTEDVNQTRRDHSAVPTLPSTTSNGRTNEPKVSQPEYFYGHRNKLSSFITQITMVIALQPSRFTTELSKILYAGSFLRETAFLWFQPHVTATPASDFMGSFDLFCEELRKTFGDPDEEASAERHLYVLRQKGSAASYIAEFMRHAVLVKWNDQAMAAQFYRGLKDIIKDELARVGRPKDLRELQQAVVRIDTRLFERQVEKGDLSTRTDYNRNQYPNQRTSFTKTQTTFQRPSSGYQATTVTRPAEHLRAGFPSSKPNGFTRRGKLNPAEYQRRKDNNLCLYCGEKGHLVLQCPLTTSTPARLNSAVPTKTTTQKHLLTKPEKAGKV